MSNNPSDQVIQGTMGHYLQMPYNRYLWLRLEFMMICDDEIEAKIMRIVEYDIEGARIAWFNNASALAANGKPYPPAPEQWWVTLSYKQIMTKMYGTVKNEKTIITKLTSLIKEKKYLQKRADPENPYGAPQYTINREVVQGKLDKLPPLPMIPDVSKIYSEIICDPVPATGTPSEEKDQYQPVVPPVPASGTPRTSEWNSPVPATGTEGYQPVVHNKNSKNTKNQRERKNAAKSTPTTTDTDSLSHSSTPSLSFSPDPTLSTELPTGVDNEQAVKPTDASSLIVIDATSNRQAEAAPSQVESMTTRNASNEANTGINNDLDPEQQRIASYLEELEFDFDLTPLNKQHLTKLAKRVKSGEQMKSLKAFTENQELLKGKTIYLGNLANANNLNGWRQSEQAKQRAEAQKSAPINPSKLTSVSGMRNYSAEPEIQPTIQKPPQDGLVQIPKFSLKGLRQQMKKEGKLV